MRAVLVRVWAQLLLQGHQHRSCVQVQRVAGRVQLQRQRRVESLQATRSSRNNNNNQRKHAVGNARCRHDTTAHPHKQHVTTAHSNTHLLHRPHALAVLLSSPHVSNQLRRDNFPCPWPCSWDHKQSRMWSDKTLPDASTAKFCSVAVSHAHSSNICEGASTKSHSVATPLNTA